MTQKPTPQPLTRDQLPEAPENLGWFRQYDGTWKLEYIGSGRCDEFRADNIADLREIANILETANGLAPQAEGERGVISAANALIESLRGCSIIPSEDSDDESTQIRGDVTTPVHRCLSDLAVAIQSSTNPPRPAPVAHSQSEYKRLVAQGVDVEPPIAQSAPGLLDVENQYPNVVVFPLPLLPGHRIGSENLLVFDVVPLRARIAAGQLYVALHEKRTSGEMLTLFVDEEGSQPAYCQPPLESSARALPTIYALISQDGKLLECRDVAPVSWDAPGGGRVHTYPPPIDPAKATDVLREIIPIFAENPHYDIDEAIADILTALGIGGDG